MKKLLLTTSALVGLGLVSADFAAAQVQSSMSGIVRIRLSQGFKATDAKVSSSNYDAAPMMNVNRVQLQWDAMGTSDMGMEYGARARLRPTADAGGRHLSYVYMSGGFGKVTLGNQWGVAGGQIWLGASATYAGSGGFDENSPAGTTLSAAGATNNAQIYYPVGDGAYARHNMVSYSSPNFSGAQVHLNYSFNNGNKNDGTDGMQAVGVTYGGNFADTDVNAAFSYYQTRSEDTLDANGTVVKATANAQKVMLLAADATFGPAMVGVTYIDAGKSGVNKTKANIAAGETSGGQNTLHFATKYNFGPGAVSFGYSIGKAKVASDTGATKTYSDKRTGWVIGANYTLAPGWTVYGDYYRITNKTGNSAVTTGNSKGSSYWTVGTNVSF